MRKYLIAGLSLFVVGCQMTRKNGAGDESVIFATVNPDIGEAADGDPKPVVSVISFDPLEGPIPEVFERVGSEFWLMAENGKGTGFVTFDSNGTYQPYQSSCDELEENSPRRTYCTNKKPSEYARRCMKQASDTLNEILDNPPQEWLDFKTKYGAPEFYGWMNDYNSLTQPNDRLDQVAWYGPFNWQPSGVSLGDENYRPDGYLKWVGAIYPDGTCKTPSKGLFLRLLKIMDNCTENPGPGCCGRALPNDPNQC